MKFLHCGFLSFFVLGAANLFSQEPPAIDYGDSSSATLTSKAWAASDAKQPELVLAYAGKCVELYATKAVEMQKALVDPPTEKDAVFSQWALNDVGTCYLLKGQALEALNRKDEALLSYKTLVETLPFAQCWDPQGWFWKPADGARQSLKKLEFETLD